MKKYYLLAFSVITASVLTAQVPFSVINSAGAPQKANSGKVFTDVTPTKQDVKPSQQTQRREVDRSGFIRIGSSYYDLQTNYAMPRRLVMHPDGGISATWTTSTSDAMGYPGRGSGYNYRSSAKIWNKSDSTRVEASERTGWPSVGVLADGSVFTIGHDATNGGFYLTKSSSATSRPSVTTNVLREAPYKPIWSRAVSSGNTIHLICSYTDSAAPGEARAPRRNGIFAPMVYSRSKDGGDNWDIQHIMLPNYDSTLTNNGGADQYAIDVKGNTVAVVNADLLQGVVLWKSLDGGDTWKRIMADSFRYAPYNAKREMLDTPISNDGTVDVLIDGNDNVHVFWGLGRVLDTDTTDESYSFYPGLQGIVHWDEASNKQTIIASGAAFDNDGDGINALEQSTFASLQNGAVPAGMSTVARLGNTSAMRQPSSGIAADGSLYCIFSVPVEGVLSDLGANYRDLGVSYSVDGGATWSAPQNITQVRDMEDDFGCVAKTVDDFLHVMWQQDEIPGTNLQNNQSGFGNHPVNLGVMYYQAIPVSEIKAGTIGHYYGLNTEEPNTGKVMVVNQNYPNPFQGSTDVLVYLTKPGSVNVEVRNAMGALVSTQSYDNLSKGNHILSINGESLSTGIYTYTLISGGSSVSKTMMVK